LPKLENAAGLIRMQAGSSKAAPIVLDSSEDEPTSQPMMLSDADEDDVLQLGDLQGDLHQAHDEHALDVEMHDACGDDDLSRGEFSPPSRTTLEGLSPTAEGTALERSTSEEGLARALKRSRSFSPKAEVQINQSTICD
jgi:hypothetical protein